MVKYVLSWFETIFLNCAVWTEQLLTAVDGAGVVLAAFCVVLVIGLLFIPMRGGNLVASFNSVSEFGSHVMYKGKHSKSAKRPNYSKMGKFQKGNSQGRSDRNARLRAK